jgi:methyltransferase (TIGR00027 family)
MQGIPKSISSFARTPHQWPFSLEAGHEVAGLEAACLIPSLACDGETMIAGLRSMSKPHPACAVMAESPIKDVSDTAFWIAHLRAVETERADAVCRDPLAGRLAGERGREISAAMPMSGTVGWTVAIRTCIIDDYIEFAIGEGLDTILNLGAGLDTRPYRMDLPASLKWVEADYPHIIEYKERLLAGEHARCRLERVKVDLADLPQRRGFFASLNAGAKKMLILTEGVVPYLSIEEAASLADDLRALDHAGYWVVDYFSAEAMKYRLRKGMLRVMQNAPFRFAPADWFGFFHEHGWQAKEIRYVAEEAERLHRPIPLPRLMKIAMQTWALFLSKERRKALRESMGYVLLEPS